MEKMVSDNRNALRFLMNDDLYILANEPNAPVQVTEPLVPVSEPPSIVAADTPQKTAVPGPVSFDYLGENNRYFLLIINNPEHSKISDLHLETLLKIMKAKGLELRDLAVLNIHRYPEASFTELKDFFSCSKAVLFGINPQLLGLAPLSTNIPGKQANTNILATYSLDEMIDNVEKKRQFWTVMKDF